MNRRHFITAAAAAVAGSGPLFAESTTGWKSGQSLPNLASFGLTGSLPSTKGKVVYLDFWASWCKPCKASFPVLDGWQKTYASRGFTVIGISVDEKADDYAAFLKKNAVGFPTLHDAAQKLVAAAKVSTMPTSFLIGRDGLIHSVHSGFKASDAAGLTTTIETLLEAKK